MNQTAKVIDMQDQLIIKEFGIEEITTANIALMEKQIREIPEKPETKEQYEESKRFNIDAKKLLPRIEERRRELKAPVMEKGKAIDDTAKKAVAMVKPLIELSGIRRQAWEDWKAAEKAEKELAEKIRVGKIQWHMDGLEVDCEAGLEYNTQASIIFHALEIINDLEISEADFQERTEEAKAKLSAAISATETALENRKKFEADQAEAARVKAAQEAEAKRLEAQKAEIEENQRIQNWFNMQYQETVSCINSNDIVFLNTYIQALKSTQVSDLGDRQQEANEYIDATILLITEKRDTLIAEQKVSEEESERLRMKEEYIQAEREKLERDKAVAEREAVWDEAHMENFNRDHASAIIENDIRKSEAQAAQADFDACHAAAMIEHDAYLRRKQILAKDKLKIQEQINLIDTAISDIKPCDFDTDEAAKVIADLYVSIKDALSLAEKIGAELR